MKRRDFLAAAGGAGLTALVATQVASAQGAPTPPTPAQVSETFLSYIRTAYPLALSTQREFVEVRKYTVSNAEKRAQLVEVLDRALIPGLNRQGIRPVGVFVPIAREQNYALNVFVAIPHKTMDSFVNANIRLVADSVFMRAAAPMFETTSRDPLYTDCVTWLHYNFPTMPVIEAPDMGPNRVFEWRLYRSFNIERNVAKIHMFDQGGELPLFREIGLNPIFFGDVVAGNKLPALAYIIGCPSLEAHAAAWRVFGSHPKWVAMRDLREYADTATDIDRVVMTPSPGSQI